MKKLTPCCEYRCLVAGCDINEAGGCYCQCRAKGYQTTLKNVVAGHSLAPGDVFIYYPNKEEAAKAFQNLSVEEKQNHTAFLENAKKELDDLS